MESKDDVGDVEEVVEVSIVGSSSDNAIEVSTSFADATSDQNPISNPSNGVDQHQTSSTLIDNVEPTKDKDFYVYKPDFSKMTEDERLLAPVVTKSTSIAVWQAPLGLAKITKMRGNMWRKVGFTVNNTNFLYPEEALYMFEKGALAVTKTAHGNDFMNKREIYEAVLEVISIPCYLTYCRLKNLDYVVYRHKKTIRAFDSIESLRDTIVQHANSNLVNMLVSFDIFLDEPGFSKKAIKDQAPVAYVVISEKNFFLPSDLFLKLIEEATTVPVIISAVTSTGFVLLEEFTDAEKTLDLTNSRRNAKIIYGRPHMKRILGEEFFAIEEVENSSSSESEGEMEVEESKETTLEETTESAENPASHASAVEDSQTQARDSIHQARVEDREEVDERPSKRQRTSESEGSGRSFMSKCIIL